ncbi:MAG: hypothetical protein IJ193_06755 [Bacilli bacterium]|nr:hypothetical protein [Bacilli bacterium]
MKHSKELEKIIQTDVGAGEVIRIHYSNSGDMNGNRNYADLDFEKKIFRTEKTPAHNIPAIFKEYKVTDEDLNKIRDYIKEYNLCAWSLVPEEDFFALDAPQMRLSFVCQNEGSYHQWFTLKQFLKLPEDGHKAYHVFLDLFFSLEKEENLIRIYEEEMEDSSPTSFVGMKKMTEYFETEKKD